MSLLDQNTGHANLRNNQSSIRLNQKQKRLSVYTHSDRWSDDLITRVQEKEGDPASRVITDQFTGDVAVGLLDH
ncbi:hypothetical protein J6590_032248 [Homalodisca vitripennis]|nr:hypothetical protein J6590_032248 [Homalodisca vitripennis]